MKKNRFYVYAYLDTRKPGSYTYGNYSFEFLPFYVGKGSGRRIGSHLRGSYLRPNTFKNNRIKKMIRDGVCPVAVKIAEHLSEREAFDLEAKVMKIIGRADSGDGPLTNASDGGGGQSGHIVSRSTRMKISRSLMGKTKGRHITKAWREKISKNNARYWTGRSHTKEVLARISRKLKGKSFPHMYCKYRITSPEGEVFVVEDGLQRFCDRHGLCRPHMVSVATGRRKHHRKWKCRKIA